MRHISVVLLLSLCALSGRADTCTTQSQMAAAERDSLLEAGTAFAREVQANDAAGVKGRTMAQVAGDFGAIQSSIADTSTHVKGASFVVENLFVLDAPAASAEEKGPQDAQFFCSLNKSAAEVTFQIPALPRGRYGLVLLSTEGIAAPWQMAFLLQKAASGWEMAGFYPKARTAGGHDGVWFWKQGREFAARKQLWNAWIEYAEADQLLRPVVFMSSTHLDQMRDEWTKAAPPALSAGIKPSAPLVVRAKDGTEYRLSALSADASLGTPKVDVSMHFLAEPLADPVAARARNLAAARAFVAAYPELREAFHGVWVFADPASGSGFASEEPMDRLTL